MEPIKEVCVETKIDMETSVMRAMQARIIQSLLIATINAITMKKSE